MTCPLCKQPVGQHEQLVLEVGAEHDFTFKHQRWSTPRWTDVFWKWETICETSDELIQSVIDIIEQLPAYEVGCGS